MRAFRKEIVQNLEKINYDKKCHDLLVSSDEKHGEERDRGTYERGAIDKHGRRGVR